MVFWTFPLTSLWPPGDGRHWPQLELWPWAASNSQILHFIINGFAGHARNFYISIHFIINGFPGLLQASVAHNAL